MTFKQFPNTRCPATAALLCGLALWASALAGRTAETAVVDSFEYADARSAQSAWQPMSGSAAVAPAMLEGRRALRLACNFAGTTIERASWDRQVQLDLATAEGIRFEVFCRDASPISYFSIYFQSGEGWYHGSFFPESSAGWSTITLGKAQMTTEGKPAGWGKIRTIRISAWRARDADTEFYLRDLRQTGVLGADAVVAILQSDYSIQQLPAEKRSVEQYSEWMTEAVRKLGIGCSVLSDLEVTPALLGKAKLVILPFNPVVPDPVAEDLAAYLRGGGKVAAFYTIPEKLRPHLNIGPGSHVRAERQGSFATIRFRDGALSGAPAEVAQRSWNITAYQPVPGTSHVLAEWVDDQGKPTGQPALLGSSNSLVMTHVLLQDDAARKHRMLLAMIGSLVPEIWRQAADAAIGSIAAFGGFDSFQQAFNRISAAGGKDERVSRALAAAGDLRASAIKLVSARRFAESIDQSSAAGQKLQEAFCRAQKPELGEFRAFWCHSAFGVQGLSWDEAVERLATNGFTAIIPNMLWGGAAYYPSKVLPVAAQAVERGDQIAQCLAACRKHGVQVHVWKVNWNLGGAAPAEFVERMRREQRLQASSAGKEERWLCPSHPENQQLEVESMLEIARNYDVDGIHFDYIRYPDGDHCFCSGCRERFQRATGAAVQAWPKDVLGGGPFRQTWLDWRRANITAVVRAVSEKARAIKPKLKISAAVFQNWATDRDGVGQDWKLWCEKGYVDFVCPMDYTPSNASFNNMIGRQLQWAGRTPCYPGIGVSASSSHFGVDRVIEQIQITRERKTGGFVVFNYGVAESRDLLPLLGLGITARR